jgi:predicted O-linked N-acetylglucosamine transferase (SPINDLY family)
MMCAGRFNDAILVLKQGLDRFPHHMGMMIQMANILLEMKDIKKSYEVMELAIEMDPTNKTLYVAYGSILIRTRQHEKAIQILEKGLEIDPHHTPLHNNLGSVYIHMRNFIKASEHLLVAAKADPTRPEIIFNLGMSFDGMDKYDMAIKFYDEVIKLDASYALAKCSKASILCKHGMSQEACALYEEGLIGLSKDRTRRDNHFLMHYSNYLFYSHYMPDRSQQKIRDDIDAWYKAICGDIKEKAKASFTNKPDPDKILNVGILSSCISRHPATQMTIRAIENIDPKKIRLFLYDDTDPGKKDDYSKRYSAPFSKVVDSYAIQNNDLAEQMRKDGIDILLELTGHSEGGYRLQLIAQRAAPVQVKWVGGLFNTSGLPQMDWLIADDVEVPEGEEKWYTERIYRMPDDYIVYDPPPYVSEVAQLPALKNGYVTFGNFNNLSKTNSYSIALWADILKAVPGSKLMLKVKRMDTPFAKQHVEESFASHGIGIDRLIIEGGEKHKQFMEAYNRIDIALDPHPYTGGLTTCEAMWMGVPVITLPGWTFAGKHAASHLSTAGLEDWVAKSAEDYVAIAQKWSKDLDGLSKLRQGLREQMAASPLVDGARFARNLETALQHMWQDWCVTKIRGGERAPKKSKTQNKQSRKK